MKVVRNKNNCLYFEGEDRYYRLVAIEFKDKIYAFDKVTKIKK